MKKITSIIISIFCIIPFISNAQDKLTSSNVYDVSSYVSDNFKLKDKTLDTLCLYTTVFIKFRISEKGNIDDLTLTERIPDVIKKALEKAIKSSDGHWSNLKTDIEYFANKSFILPVVLFYGKGCGEGNGELELNISDERRAREYRRLDNTVRSANYAVQDLLNSNGKSVNMLECVILSPLSIGAQGY
ncbi:hypothetical protein [Pedobacter paludis]|uniref:TonB C-terminal domain-containing protein n=1 Tax=Pedobacter paludis TaxID=2203212 RepID=A0A317ESX9_9SPHI|nr:hypothetical protein [Pedobacter paludis]PWS29784.1 hypothetical protein DF947_20820 [Pedobacter paludis]